MKVFVVLVLALATVSAGVLPKRVPIHFKDMPKSASSIQGRITNGKDAEEGQFPYQVGLSFSSSSGSWWCGGSIIDAQWVLTAAHCTDGASAVTISYGSTVRTTPKLTQTVSSSNFIQHASYNAIILRNDISLIKTPAVAFTSDIAKVDLNKDTSSLVGSKATASGFGLTSDSSNSVSNKLQYAILEIIANSDCAATYGTLVVTDRNVCTATTDAISTCSGDSGGPLVLNARQVGVVSFGSSAGCEKGYHAGFTRVSYYVDWIVENTGIKFD